MDQSGASPPTSQTERVILTLREMLLRGDFAAGERLAELTLVRRLTASRTPVRLALDRLAREGVLEALPSGGFRVRAFAIADIRDARHQVPCLRIANLHLVNPGPMRTVAVELLPALHSGSGNKPSI